MQLSRANKCGNCTVTLTRRKQHKVHLEYGYFKQKRYLDDDVGLNALDRIPCNIKQAYHYICHIHISGRTSIARPPGGPGSCSATAWTQEDLSGPMGPGGSGSAMVMAVAVPPPWPQVRTDVCLELADMDHSEKCIIGLHCEDTAALGRRYAGHWMQRDGWW